ncbi:MAG: c-type cytochrome [Pigmentiphaga sp.]|uniref:c-type cytochrome n=1 Tax=Pigmentiphaga sp. TaxID=1977564 RepID=UPI0029BA7A52|nr:c-type cytochrome [Pigmentiphaga sp.]MDX3905161.1 c-type cytochrome [Pigmentiphaga sp.]
MKPSISDRLCAAGSLAAFFALGASAVHAQGPAAAPASPPSQASTADTGRMLAEQGVPARGVAACASCHGARGEGNAAAGFPRLTGLSSVYMARQLVGYAQGERENPVMTPIAKSLSPEERTAVSAYYAALPIEESPAAVPPPGNQPKGNPERAKVLATVGDEALQVQGCVNCHGPGGMGEAPDYPLLAAQHAGYLAAALEAFKNGSRKTDPSGQMEFIAKQLSSEDIASLAAYFSSLPLPAGMAAQAAETRTLRQRALSGTSGPLRRTEQAGQGAAGTGTEGGAPTTGGGQGPGGGGASGAESTGGPPRK